MLTQCGEISQEIEHEIRGCCFFSRKKKSVFGSMVVSAFQITFHAKKHVNDFFYFLKIIFNISTS